MKPRKELFYSLDQPWSSFSDAWKKSRRKPSEKSVHDLRINARRLLENLEFVRALSEANGVRKLKRRFKKFLKRTSTLRDVQVQLETLATLPQSSAMAGFTRHLKRLERKRIEKIEKKLKSTGKRRLTRTFKDVRSRFLRSQEKAGKIRTYQSIRQVLADRRNEFLEAKRRFDQSQPHSEEALHQMRIALKKLRYATEAAQPKLPDAGKEEIEAMRTFQKLMGDSRDFQMLRVELEHWANKTGRKLTVIPALQYLEDQREMLLKKLLESSQDLHKMLDFQKTAPAA